MVDREYLVIFHFFGHSVEFQDIDTRYTYKTSRDLILVVVTATLPGDCWGIDLAGPFSTSSRGNGSNG
jgi:hypothetical protein